MIADGMMRDLHEVEGAHPIWSDGCGRFGQSDHLWLLLLSTPLHQRAASRVQHPNHKAVNSLFPQVARKGSTLSGFVQRSRLEREVGRDLHSNKWEEV